MDIRSQVAAEIRRLTKVLALLDGGQQKTKPRRGKRRTMSAAARAKISAAQKARWAKTKGK